MAEQLSSFLRRSRTFSQRRQISDYIVIKWFVSHFRKSNLNSHGVYETLDIFNTISLKCNVTSYPDLTLAVGDLGSSSTFEIQRLRSALVETSGSAGSIVVCQYTLPFLQKYEQFLARWLCRLWWLLVVVLVVVVVIAEMIAKSSWG